MKQTKKYKGEGQPEFLYTVKVNGRNITKGMEATLTRGIGQPAGRYRLSYAEIDRNGTLALSFFGPTRRIKQKYRLVHASSGETGRWETEQIKTVHAKTRETDTDTENEATA